MANTLSKNDFKELSDQLKIDMRVSEEQELINQLKMAEIREN